MKCEVKVLYLDFQRNTSLSIRQSSYTEKSTKIILAKYVRANSYHEKVNIPTSLVNLGQKFQLFETSFTLNHAQLKQPPGSNCFGISIFVHFKIYSLESDIRYREYTGVKEMQQKIFLAIEKDTKKRFIHKNLTGSQIFFHTPKFFTGLGHVQHVTISMFHLYQQPECKGNR